MITTKTTPYAPVATAAAASLLVLLAACGSSDDSPEVASIPTASSQAEGDAADGGATDGGETSEDGTTSGDEADTAGRPVLGVDDDVDRDPANVTRAERIYNAYNTCLLDHGAVSGAGQHLEAGRSSPGDVQVVYPAPADAQAACLELRPVSPPALDAATNPDFHTESLAYVACLEEGGLYVTLANNEDLTWTYAEDRPVPDDVGAIEDDCMGEVFGG